MAHSIKAILNNLFSTQESWHIQLLNAWPTIVGSIKTTVQLIKITNDTLTIGVMDSCWLQELYLLSPLLLTRINQQLDQPRIKNLRFKLTGTVAKKKQRPPSLPADQHQMVILSSAENSILSSIEDEQLRGVLRDYLIRCYRFRKED